MPSRRHPDEEFVDAMAEQFLSDQEELWEMVTVEDGHGGRRPMFHLSRVDALRMVAQLFGPAAVLDADDLMGGAASASSVA